MKKMIAFAAVLLSLSSCQKMSFRHTCTCELKRSVDGVEEVTGTVSDQQMGTYNTAKDSCTAMQERRTYTTSRNGYIEAFSAACQVE